MRPLLIYIHGFNSSPLSEKAQELRAYVQDNELAVELIIPGLPNYPGASYRELEQLVEQHLPRPITLIGSSLGGFMATTLAQQFGLKAVLINPAVRPSLLIGILLGENENPHTGEKYFLHEGHVDELIELEVQSISRPERLMVLLQTGDELLDYRQAVSYYQGCPQIVEEGGNHRFENFEKHLPRALKFLELV